MRWPILGGWELRCCQRPGDGRTSPRSWCRASRVAADASAWCTAIPAWTCPAESLTCASYATANRVPVSWPTSMVRWPVVLGRAETYLSRAGQLANDPGYPGHRGVVGGLLRGTARVPAPGAHALLLDGAVGHALAMGAPALEGYPVDPGIERIDQTSGYVGTVQLFEAHGFRRVRQTTRRQVANPAGSCAASYRDCSAARSRSAARHRARVRRGQRRSA